MRKNSVRKFIHAILDLLPSFVIPIFAININQKSVEPIQVEVQEKINVDFNQLYKTTKNTFNAIGLTFTNNNNGTWTINGTTNFTSDTNDVILDNQTTTYIQGHFYLFGVKQTNSAIQSYIMRMGNWVGGQTQRIYQCYTTDTNVFFNLRIYKDSTFNDFVIAPQVYDLTQMFGEGNEPTTIDEFNNMFTDTYYDYTLSQKMLVNKPTTTIYNDTDIGSQFLYSLYIPVHDYFNFNNLFNMGAIYDWIQLNLFSGTTPLPVFIIWNIIVYEFFVDLIFLLYSVFMFVIDFATSMIDRFMYKSKRGI